jgi:hypothetical protein
MADGTADFSTPPTTPALSPALTQSPLPAPLGLPLTTWVQIAVVTALMAATFRFNLLRLWLKTNPFNGEPNLFHSIFLKIIVLYYL